jgi:hypothetical protein
MHFFILDPPFRTQVLRNNLYPRPTQPTEPALKLGQQTGTVLACRLDFHTSCCSRQIQWPQCCSFGQHDSVQRPDASKWIHIKQTLVQFCSICIYTRRRTALNGTHLEGPGIFSSPVELNLLLGLGSFTIFLHRPPPCCHLQSFEVF